jgi:ABC-2 type transport system ATP-binding protein
MIDVQEPTPASASSENVEEQRVSTSEIAVSLRGLTKQFGALRAVDSLSLEIRRGETVALLGPNGAGKTTTISMLLGLLRPDVGTVSVLGTTPSAAIRSGRTGAMLQEGSLMPGVRVAELLDYVLSLTSSRMTRERLVATAGLEGLEGRRIDRLSGGQTQRMRFALAIASEPDVLVLDEPTAAMDVEARYEFWASMRTYTAAGHTVLFATHYLEEAEAFASRVVIISHGKVVSDGTLADLKRGFGTRTVRFRSSHATAEALEELPGVSEVERQGQQGQQVTLKTSDADATVRALVGSGIAWQDLEVHGATLDDVFLTLVGNGENGGNR